MGTGSELNLTPNPQLPAGRRIYAIGDVHGRADLLEMMHRRIAADLELNPIANPLLICLGDYVDRGPDSAGVLDLLLEEAPAGMKRIALMGNHEALMLRFLVDESVAPVWLANGGDATLESYGIDPLDSYERARRQLDRLIPRPHRALLESLALSHSEGDYFFVHAGVKPGLALDQQRQEDMLWIRGEFLHSDADHGKIVVHGHSITAEPEIRPNRIGIDTGAYASGRLTCLVLEDRKRRFFVT
jgi:diadenosine tetraphosphatase ApaH/serine/threonine PP2A family protein phosphatase